MLTVISDKCGAGHSTLPYKGRVFCPTLKKMGISLAEQKTKIFSLHRTVSVSLEYFRIAKYKIQPLIC